MYCRLKQKWVEVTVDTQVDALIAAVNHGLKSEGLESSDKTVRTMVFANTVEAVEAVANILERASIQCYRYHKNHTLEERAKILADFREKGGIFVCTDAAARGVDVPNVSHVVQVLFESQLMQVLLVTPEMLQMMEITSKALTFVDHRFFLQADFATSAVDFLHRIGRTARAGQYGLVTSLYTEANHELVEAIHQAEKTGQPVVILYAPNSIS